MAKTDLLTKVVDKNLLYTLMNNVGTFIKELCPIRRPIGEPINYLKSVSEENLLLAQQSGIIVERVEDRRLIARTDGILFNSIEDLAEYYHHTRDVIATHKTSQTTVKEFVNQFSLKNGISIESYKCEECKGVVKGVPYSYWGNNPKWANPSGERKYDMDSGLGIWMICRICYSGMGGWPHT